MRNIIVIGASAGGISAVKNLLAGFDNTMDAAFFIVQHLSRNSDVQAIVNIFQRHTPIICEVAKDNMIINSGHMYFAPADHHLFLHAGRMAVTHGAHENKYRPSIDVLFRSAAVAFGNGVIGIILTGMLEDGTSGMSAIKRCGGVCVVQNPADAEFLSMPQSVLNTVKVDYQEDLLNIPARIREILARPLPPKVPIPNELLLETKITQRMTSTIDDLKNMGNQSDFTCPECGGGLWSVNNDPVHRYRCYTGHVYTEKLLLENQKEQLEESVWVSIRMLEEKSNLFKVMAGRHPAESALSDSYMRRIGQAEKHIETLKKLLADLAA